METENRRYFSGVFSLLAWWDSPKFSARRRAQDMIHAGCVWKVVSVETGVFSPGIKIRVCHIRDEHWRYTLAFEREHNSYAKASILRPGDTVRFAAQNEDLTSMRWEYSTWDTTFYLTIYAIH